MLGFGTAFSDSVVLKNKENAVLVPVRLLGAFRQSAVWPFDSHVKDAHMCDRSKQVVSIATTLARPKISASALNCVSYVSRELLSDRLGSYFL